MGTISGNVFCRLSRVITPLGERVFTDGMNRQHAIGLERYFEGVRLNQGSQVLRVPEGSHISNLVLSGGASFNSNWAALRGSVLKFDSRRTDTPVKIDGRCWAVPSAHTLMDEHSLRFTIEERNEGKNIPFRHVREITSSEPLFLVHSGFCHPNELFLPKGRFTNTMFYPDECTGTDLKNAYRMNEAILNYEGRSIDILTLFGITASRILITLAEGGMMLLEDQ